MDISRKEHYFFFKLKKFINYTLITHNYFMTKNSFVAEVTFKGGSPTEENFDGKCFPVPLRLSMKMF